MREKKSKGGLEGVAQAKKNRTQICFKIPLIHKRKLLRFLYFIYFVCGWILFLRRRAMTAFCWMKHR